MKYLVAFLLLLVVAAGTALLTSSTLKLERGRINQITFACGAVDSKTGNIGVYTDGYTYTFKGQPLWMMVEGNSLAGTVPVGISGEYPVTVSYRSENGTNTGSQTWILSANSGQLLAGNLVKSLDSAATTRMNYSYFQAVYDGKNITAAGPGYFVALCPVLPTSEILTKPVLTDVVGSSSFNVTATSALSSALALGTQGNASTPIAIPNAFANNTS